jgi:hypothetical protein
VRKNFVIVSSSILLILAIIFVWNLTCSAQISKPPELSEVQKLQLQNFALQDQVLQAQFIMIKQAKQQLDHDQTLYVTSIEQAHPGWILNRQTLKLEKPQPVKK